jgi:hypothetical protein
MRVLNKQFKFDPPLAIPGNGGTATIEAMGDFLDDGQPDFVQVSVFDGQGKNLSIGLFQHDAQDAGVYRLIHGEACTGDATTGLRIERAK